MKVRHQFLSSIKREFLEVVRQKKLLSYIVVGASILVLNLFFHLIANDSAFTHTENIIMTYPSWITSQAQVNSLFLNIYLVWCIYILMDNLNKEIKTRQMVLPFSMGLKPLNYIGAKLIVQTLVPSFIAGFLSFINAIVTMIFFDNAIVQVVNIGIIKISPLVMLLSSIGVFLSIAVYLNVLFSLCILTKNSLLSFVITIGILVFGEPLFQSLGFIQTNFLTSFSKSLIFGMSTNQFLLTNTVILAVLALLLTASILVFSDRHDKNR